MSKKIPEVSDIQHTVDDLKKFADETELQIWREVSALHQLLKTKHRNEDDTMAKELMAFAYRKDTVKTVRALARKLAKHELTKTQSSPAYRRLIAERESLWPLQIVRNAAGEPRRVESRTKHQEAPLLTVSSAEPVPVSALDQKPMQLPSAVPKQTNSALEVADHMPGSSTQESAIPIHQSKVESKNEMPWLNIDSRDPTPGMDWYTPARYFARQLVIEDSTLLLKRLLLAQKVADSLKATGFLKRGNKKALNKSTVLKAFVNVTLG
jgi:hypothetical protein